MLCKNLRSFIMGNKFKEPTKFVPWLLDVLIMLNLGYRGGIKRRRESGGISFLINIKQGTI